jgi:hypothetical protein
MVSDIVAILDLAEIFIHFIQLLKAFKPNYFCFQGQQQHSSAAQGVGYPIHLPIFMFEGKSEPLDVRYPSGMHTI